MGYHWGGPWRGGYALEAVTIKVPHVQSDGGVELETKKDLSTAIKEASLGSSINEGQGMTTSVDFQPRPCPNLPTTASSSGPVTTDHQPQVLIDTNLGDKPALGTKPPIEPDPKPPNIRDNEEDGYKTISNRKKGKKQSRGNPATPSRPK